MNGHYSIINETITPENIDYITNRNNNYNNFVYIRNSNFKDKLDSLPLNTVHLEINSENYIVKFVPSFIKWLSIYNCKGIEIVPPSVLILELTIKFIDSNPFILNIIPFGVKSIIINCNTISNNMINLDVIPESIETIHIINSVSETTNINITKRLPNLKWIKFNKYLRGNENIKSYLITQYKDEWESKFNGCDFVYDCEYYYEMIVRGINVD